MAIFKFSSVLFEFPLLYFIKYISIQYKKDFRSDFFWTGDYVIIFL